MIMKVEYILERLVSSLLSDYEALSKMTAQQFHVRIE